MKCYSGWCPTVLLWVVVSLQLSGCNSGRLAVDMNDAPSASVPKNAVKIVNGALYTSLAHSDWYYKGVRVFDGVINAYVDTPKAPAMDKASLKQYVQYAICPKADNQLLWRTLGRIPIKIHLYIEGRHSGIRTDCENPMV